MSRRLDELDQDPDVLVVVHVPPDTISVNSSFFREMFGDSIRALGEEEFRRKYVFVGRNIENTIEESIVDALSGPTRLI